MEAFSVLGRDWQARLAGIVRTARNDLLISSPYVSRSGTDLILSHLPPDARSRTRVRILTDLSPGNIYQGATDPAAWQSLSGAVRKVEIVHLPRLHAKVYVADTEGAIVTSANLTAGGLNLNYEYGVEIKDTDTVRVVRDDILEYSRLGADLTLERLAAYCRIADAVRTNYRRQQAAAAASARHRFKEALRTAEDELLRLRLAGGAVHTVFARTILYLLRTHGALSTERLHPLIQAIHPDLCDDSIDRVIDGKRFGKKWKHAVRTAQQQLKKQGLITLRSDRWIVAGPILGIGDTQ